MVFGFGCVVDLWVSNKLFKEHCLFIYKYIIISENYFILKS